MNYLKLVFSLIFHPYQTINFVKADSKKFAYALISLTVLAALSSLAMLTQYSHGLLPLAKPFLNIPIENYYLVSAFLTIPVSFLQAVLFAAVAQLLSKIFGGTGNFDEQFALYAFAFPPIIYIFINLHEIIWIPLSTSSFAFWINTALYQSAIGIIIAADFVIATITVKVAQKIPWRSASVCSLISYGITALVTFTYIR